VVHRVAVGVGFGDQHAEANDETALPPTLSAEFAAEVLPATRTTLFPFAAYHAFTPRFRVYENLDTVGQSEAVRLGPSLSVSLTAGARALLSSSDTMFAIGTLGVALDPWEGLFEAAVEGSARYEDGLVVNRAFSGRLRYASAPALLGRLLLRSDVTFRSHDVTNAFISLGGDNGLRGYPSQAFFDFGASLAQATVEWRSLPFEWQSVHVGAALFYEAGSVFTELRDARLRQSVGVGARLLLPQFNRGVYRFDLAMPLDELGVRVLFSVGDNQVVQHADAAFSRLTPRR
jgi:hypothetical protein